MAAMARVSESRAAASLAGRPLRKPWSNSARLSVKAMLTSKAMTASMAISAWRRTNTRKVCWHGLIAGMARSARARSTRLAMAEARAAAWAAS